MREVAIQKLRLLIWGISAEHVRFINRAVDFFPGGIGTPGAVDENHKTRLNKRKA